MEQPGEDLPLEAPRERSLWLIDAIFLALMAGVVIWSLHPGLLLSHTTLTGGDTGAHLALPGYLLQHGLGSGITPWYPGWFAGMPAYTYYFVLPDLLAVLGAHIVGFMVSFKLATILGSLLLPTSAYMMGRMMGARRAVALSMGAFCLPFLYDGAFTIVGGNLYSTMAGEYSFSFSLALGLITLGLFFKGVRENKGYWRAAVGLSLTLAAHVLPWFFVIFGVGVWVVLTTIEIGFARNDYQGNGEAKKGTKVRRITKVWRFALGAGVLSGGLSAWWLLPFVSTQNLTNSMGYTNDTTSNWHIMATTLGWYNSSGGAGGDRWIIVTAAVAVAYAVLKREKIGLFLGVLAIGSFLAYKFDPQSVIWDERLVPFWFISIYLLGGYLIGSLVSLWGVVSGGVGSVGVGSRKKETGRLLKWAGISVAYSEMEGLVHESVEFGGETTHVEDIEIAHKSDTRNDGGFSGDSSEAGAETIEALDPPTGERLSLGTRRTKKSGLAKEVAARVLAGSIGVLCVVPGLVPAMAGELGLNTGGNQVSSWAAWNYSGYEAKPAWGEYHDIMDVMNKVGKRYGCGRAMWEYNSNQNRFGTPEALMLLPYWTKGCIGSMEGLLFESSATTPYHFLDQAELSVGPSDPQVGLSYGGVNVKLGVEHLQMLGVKYFMAYSPVIVKAAEASPMLQQVAVTTVWGVEGFKWYIFKIKDSPLVEGLNYKPNVLEGDSSRVAWLGTNERWWLNPQYWGVLGAATGPANWPRARGVGSMYKVRVRPTTVSNVDYNGTSVSFSTSQLGTPVLVKISYFPGWVAAGALGPYRVSPNLMVVIPTAHKVSLTYENTTLGRLGEDTSLALSAIGVAIWGVGVLKKRRRGVLRPALSDHLP